MKKNTRSETQEQKLIRKYNRFIWYAGQLQLEETKPDQHAKPHSGGVAGKTGRPDERYRIERRKEKRMLISEKTFEELVGLIESGEAIDGESEYSPGSGTWKELVWYHLPGSNSEWMVAYSGNEPLSAKLVGELDMVFYPQVVEEGEQR